MTGAYLPASVSLSDGPQKEGGGGVPATFQHFNPNLPILALSLRPGPDVQP